MLTFVVGYIYLAETNWNWSRAHVAHAVCVCVRANVLCMRVTCRKYQQKRLIIMKIMVGSGSSHHVSCMLVAPRCCQDADHHPINLFHDYFPIILLFCCCYFSCLPQHTPHRSQRRWAAWQIDMKPFYVSHEFFIFPLTPAHNSRYDNIIRSFFSCEDSPPLLVSAISIFVERGLL